MWILSTNFISVDYVLDDANERKRVRIARVPRPFALNVIRAPVPWKSECIVAREYCKKSLFTVAPLMRHLQNLWFNRSALLHDFKSVLFSLLLNCFQMFFM